MTSPLTPSQTVGPYLALALPWERGPYAERGGIRISGLVLDGEEVPVPDALVETWQVRPEAFARCATDDEGAWFVEVPPPEPLEGQAPHLAVSVFARGLLHRVVTRIYLPEHEEANAVDGALARVPAARRDTLIAVRSDDGYRFDIRLQGPRETVFFDV